MNDINNTPPKNKYLIPMVIVGVLFFALGFITWLNSTLINFLEVVCQVDNKIVLFLITTASYISYFVMSIPASRLLARTGYKRGMALGLLGLAAGALLFIPAANTRSYGLFLLGVFIQGAGMSLMQTAVNPYITILGPLESAAKRMSIMGVCNKVAGAVSPIVVGGAVLSGTAFLLKQINTAPDITTKAPYLDQLAAKIIFPYVIIAVVSVVMFIWVWFSSLPEVSQEDVEEEEAAEAVDAEETKALKHKNSIKQFPHAIIGVIALFLYVGCEVMAGDTIGQYGKMLGYTLDRYQYFTTYTLSFMVIGYIVGIILIPKYVSQRKALTFCAVLGVLFSVAILFTTNHEVTLPFSFSGLFSQDGSFIQVNSFNLSIFFVALLGFANSIMWPAIWPLTLNKLGHFTKTFSAFLVMSIAGGAILPLIWGALANVAGNYPQLPYIITIPCYAFILYFAVKGYRVGLNLKKGKEV